MRRSIIWTACIVLISFLMFVGDVLGASASPWVLVSNMITARDQFAGCVIGDKIYVFGGNGNPGGINLNSGEVYDINSFSWSSIAANSHNGGDGVEEVTGVAVDGKFYVFGGWGGAGTINFNEVYDPNTDTWTTLAQKPTAVSAAVPAVYGGKIYLFGGNGDSVHYNVVEAYDPVSNTWQSEANMPKMLAGEAVAVYNDSAYVMGGGDVNAKQWNTEVMVYNFVSNTWTRNYSTTPVGIYSYAANSTGTQTPVVNSKAYLVGGVQGTVASHPATNKFTIFDINTRQWQTGPSLPEPRAGQLTVADNNEVYVIGGYAVYGAINSSKSTVYCLSNSKKTSAVFNSGGIPVTLSVTGGGWYEIAGDNNDFSQITLHDTTDKSIFTIKTAAGQYTSVGDIIVDGSLNAISAKTTDLRGNITIDGTIGKIELRNIDSDHKITIGHPSNPKAGVLMNFGEVNDLSIDSNTPIKVLMCTQWLDNDANEDYIKAPSLGTLQVKGDSKNNITGDFECDLRLDGNSVTGATLTNVNIAGDVNNCTWNITGDVRTVSIKGDVNDWNLNIIPGNISSLKVGRVTESNESGAGIYVEGKINSLQATSWHGGYIDANMINSLNVSGNKKALIGGDFDADMYIAGSTSITDTGKNTLNSVQIAGKVSGGVWTVSGNAGNIQIGSSPEGSGWLTEFDSDVKTLKVTGYTDVNGAKVSGDLCVGWSSNSVKTLSVTGSVIDADIELLQEIDPKLSAIGNMTVTKWIDGSRITSAGNVGIITTGGIKNSSCFAGDVNYVDSGDSVRDLPNPSDVNDLGDALISAFTVKGIKGELYSMINSNIVARGFNNVLLSYPQYDNGGTAFGLAADYFKKIVVKDATGTVPYSNLTDPCDIKPRTDDPDFVIRVK